MYSLDESRREDPGDRVPVLVPWASHGARRTAGTAISELRGLRARFAGLGVIGRGATDLRADAHTAQRQARLVDLQRHPTLMRRIW